MLGVLFEKTAIRRYLEQITLALQLWIPWAHLAAPISLWQKWFVILYARPFCLKSTLVLIKPRCLLEGRRGEAVALYESSFQISLSEGKSKSDLGAIICELGFAQVQNQELRKGRRTLEEGIALLQDQEMRGERVDHGHMVRALVKVAFANVVTGHLWKGAQYLADAQNIADSKGLDAYAARREIRYVGRFFNAARKRFRRGSN
jgi:hypothetical protein